MPDEKPKPAREPKPSPVNGPAFLAFGIIFVILAIGMKIPALLWPAVAFSLIGFLGIWLERRYQKAAGIEDVLPGGRPKDDQ